MIGAEMNGYQLNGKARHLDPVPGCLGRMVNFFDLASSKNRLLTDKPHNDGYSLSRSQPDVSRVSSFAGNEMQDEVITERSSLSKKTRGIPVKMLLAQEMSKDFESRQNPPNVVARLMGLDALPQQKPGLAGQRSHSQCHTQNRKFENCRQQENDFEVHSHEEQSDTDIYEKWHQSQRKNCKRDKSPQKGSCNENVTEKKLALIRQKFMEAKRLATDEKLRQTKEFQDALDLLSSNGELFLKVLQEPNSLFSHHSYVGQSIPPPLETKRITVLKPSKMLADDKCLAPARRNEKQAKKQVQVSLWDNHSGFSPTMSMWKANDRPDQPTRIVVLKPSPAKLNDSKALPSSSPSSPDMSHSECFLEELEEEEAQEAREVAKEIAQQMRQNLAGHRRDETLLSSVFSNGYTGDESSFDKSENVFTTGNLSDLEVMSPTSRRSWEYVNGYVSPYSLSSFSRASYSPESLVCREAKRRLSERWAMIASNGCNQEQRQIRKSTSTLGEMLALSEIKDPEICEEDDNRNHDPRGSTSCLSGDMGTGGSVDASPRNLLRSKSLPVSSTAYGDRLNNEVSNPSLCREDALKDMMKTKAPKSSFTGKVTSLFFSRNKKPKQTKSSKTQSNDESQVAAGISGSLASSGRVSNDQCEADLSSASRLHSGNITRDLNDKRQGQGIYSQQGGSCFSEPAMSRIEGVGKNQEESSPISVLDQPFEEDGSVFLGWSRAVQPNTHGKQMPLSLGKFNLIDKSPPIGSIARTLSWDECIAEPATTYPLSSPFVSPGAEDNEDEWRSLVQSLLTLAGLDDDGQLGKNFTRWHSLDSPLDPSLRDKYIDLTAKEPLHEAKRRQLRSTQKLVFDSVNAALVDITFVRKQTGAGKMLLESGSAALADRVWDRVEEWVSGNVKSLSEDDGDSGSLVEMEVMKEVVGKGWADQMRLEVDNIGKEIERKLLQELLEDSSFRNVKAASLRF